MHILLEKLFTDCTDSPFSVPQDHICYIGNLIYKYSFRSNGQIIVYKKRIENSWENFTGKVNHFEIDGSEDTTHLPNYAREEFNRCLYKIEMAKKIFNEIF